MGVDTLAVASWGLLRTAAPSKIEHLAASWGLLDSAPAPPTDTGDGFRYWTGNILKRALQGLGRWF